MPELPPITSTRAPASLLLYFLLSVMMEGMCWLTMDDEIVVDPIDLHEDLK